MILLSSHIYENLFPHPLKQEMCLAFIQMAVMGPRDSQMY